MHPRPRRNRILTIAASIAACLPGAIATPTARAGTIWVTNGNMNAGQTGDCNAFGLYGDLSVFYAPQGCPMTIENDGAVPDGQNAYWMTTAPSGIVINSAWTAPGDVSTLNVFSTGFAVGDFWIDNASDAYRGSTLATGQNWFNTGLEGSSNINSQIYGVQLACERAGGCSGVEGFAISGIELAGTETSAPFITGQGALWGSGSYVWNPPGDAWPVTLYASDLSGICSSQAVANTGVQLNGPSEPRDSTVWQQCPNPVSWSFSVDTRSQVPTDGEFAINLTATNAAGVVGSAPTKTVLVDNAPVGVSFRTPNDPNPSVWVSHPVNVNATATTGPSKVAGMNCSVDSPTAKAYTAAGLTVDGDGVHNVTCTAWNNAVDPQGNHDTGSASMSVHIDEAPPSLSFEPQNPRDPTGVVVDTSDSESGVAAGSIQIAPAGSGTWTSIPTSFDGARLATHFDDAGLHGPYSFKATSCDNVGNCASTTEQMTLPVRVASDQEVSLTKIVDPVRRRVVIKRIRVGWHWVTLRQGSRLVRVKRGGHFKTVKITEYVQRCTTRRIRTGPHTWRLKRNCAPPHVRLTSTLQVPYGRSVTIHGLYTTGQGAPLSGQTVHIFAAPDNGFGAFSQIGTATTSGDGSWTTTLPAGSSRIIRAATDGTATILPSSGQATVIVPAKIRLLKVWPQHVAWGGTVHLVGQLFGGFLPAGGALVRLRIGYKSTYSTYGVEEHVTGDGRFSTVASFGPGDPSVSRTYWFQIASLPMGNYPYAPAASQKVSVIVGGRPG
jgi:hypothetical protein